MKYELKKLNCPSCGATIDVDIKDRDTVFCSYCGTQIAIDDGETVVTHNINIHDDAKVIREENRHIENEKNRSTLKWILIGSVTLVLVMFIAYLLIHFLS